jgi:hypothetical protein
MYFDKTKTSPDITGAQEIKRKGKARIDPCLYPLRFQLSQASPKGFFVYVELKEGIPDPPSITVLQF